MIGDNLETRAHPNSPYFWWVPSKAWWLYRSIPSFLILAVWSILFYALLSFIPVLLPVYAFPLIAVAMACFTYLMGKPLRSLLEPFFRPIYKFVLKRLFAKSETEAQNITDNLAEKRSLAQQLVDYVRYFFNMRLRDDEIENERLKIRIAKFNVRWGSAAKLLLNSFFLTTGTLLFVPLVFGVSLTPSITFSLIAFGIFGGICSSLVAGNLFGNGLIDLAKTSYEFEAFSIEKSKKPVRDWAAFFDYIFGQLISMAHALAGGAACFSAGMQLTMALGVSSFILTNPLATPILLAFVALCSLAIARGYYALTLKVWNNKEKILKGFFRGNDGDGKPVGNLQRIFGLLGAISIGITISLAFVMLYGTSFASIINFPIYDVVGSNIQFNFSPVSALSFILTGIIGGTGVGIIFFTGVFKLSSDFGKFWDSQLSSQKRKTLTYDDIDLEKQVIQELREKYGFKEGENEGPALKPGFFSLFYCKHWDLERSLRTPIIILMNALATGMLTAVPNVVILMTVVPQIAIPIAITLFAITAFASLCKDYMNWLPGYENKSHAYTKMKAYLYEAKLLEKNAKGLSILLNAAKNFTRIEVSEVKKNDNDNEASLPNLDKSPKSLSPLNLKEKDKEISREDFWGQLKAYAPSFNEINSLYDHANKVTFSEVVSTLEKLINFTQTQPLILKKRAEALHDGYDPHLYVLVLTGAVRIISNLLALLATPIALCFSERSAAQKLTQQTPELKTLTAPRGKVPTGAEANGAQASSPSSADHRFFAPPSPLPPPPSPSEVLNPLAETGNLTNG